MLTPVSPQRPSSPRYHSGMDRRRPTSSDLPLATGVIASEIAAASAAGQPAQIPEWIKITPRGPVKTRDGRNYSFDPEALVARFQADAIEIPIDIDHSISRKALFGDKADAIGWASALDARPDGTYAKVAWLDGGRAALAARTHRYVSPTFHHAEDGRATWLHSAALVAAPALSMPALADATRPHPETPMLKTIAKALSLPEAADEAACLAALATLRDGSVAKAVHDQALANLAAATAELGGLKKAQRDKEVAAIVDEALKAKKIVPAQKDAYVALCATDEGLAQVKALLAASPAGLQASGLDAKQPTTGDLATSDAVAFAAAARKEQADQLAAGHSISIAEAMTIIRRKAAA